VHGRSANQTCVCVTDPCHCQGPIIWTDPDNIHSREGTERTNRAGDEITEFRIDSDATVLVESIVRAKATTLPALYQRLALKPATRLPPSRGGGGCGCGGGSATVHPREAPGAYHDGIECGGHTLYDVYHESDGAGGTVFHYIPIGSC
jgi:hypothetical protein